MPHPSEALLIAFADDALDAAEHRETAAHVEACGVCRHALRDLRDAMAALKVEVALVDTIEPDAWRAGGPWRASARCPVRRARRVAAGGAVRRLSCVARRSRSSWWVVRRRR